MFASLNFLGVIYIRSYSNEKKFPEAELRCETNFFDASGLCAYRLCGVSFRKNGSHCDATYL